MLSSYLFSHIFSDDLIATLDDLKLSLENEEFQDPLPGFIAGD